MCLGKPGAILLDGQPYFPLIVLALCPVSYPNALAFGVTLFAENGCGSCHTLAEANASGTVGPDLDQVLKGKDAAFIHESIVDPDAEIASGFSAGIMPAVYGDQLDDQQLADLVAFLEQSVNG